MLNFTVGPTTPTPEVLKASAQELPYSRSDAFSAIVKETEELMLKAVDAPEDARAIFVTASGTGSMEAVVLNCLSDQDKVLVVNGGAFGERFAKLLRLHHIAHTEIKLGWGTALTVKDLAPYENKGYTAFLVNIVETSSATLYDATLIAEFCKRNDLFLIVDAISSFMADPLSMSKMGADVVIAGSQKAPNCHPGLSIDVLSKRAQERVATIECPVMYFDFKAYLQRGLDGQTPYTPAIGAIIQLHDRLTYMFENGGIEAQLAVVEERAEYFRSRIEGVFEMQLTSPTNAVTYLVAEPGTALKLVKTLEHDYGMWVCKTPGDHAKEAFRVGHMSYNTQEDVDKLIAVLKELRQN